jgi:ABC-type oligopeptide transport system substrate-binding subunit
MICRAVLCNGAVVSTMTYSCDSDKLDTMKIFAWILLALPLIACDSGEWNNPYPASDEGASILYTAFTERPKHLDPARSYSENEYEFIAQIYAPPLQYHYLKRPYQLVPLAASEMPTIRFLDRNRRPLPDDVAAEQIAYSVYEIRIKPDMRYQPHPALAKDARGNLEYHQLEADDLRGIHGLTDFPHSGTRAVMAADYAYQIKRLANPQLHSPIFGVMSEYIVGLKEYAENLQQAHQANPNAVLDMNAYPLTGVQVVDERTYRIEVIGKYPQFSYWLAMSFFAPMPQEVERFYAQAGMRERNLTLDWWPIGSGPYYLSENNPNQRMVLSRNPYYDSERYPSEGETEDAQTGLLRDAGKALPLIDKAVFTLEKETIPYWNKFLQGYYDASGISSDSFDQAVKTGSGGEANVTDEMARQGIQLATAVETSTMYAGFNWLDKTVGGNTERARKLRQAIAIAVDFEEFVSIFANGRGIVAQSPLPPGIFGYREGEAGINPVVYDWVNGAPQRKPITVAKQLLAEAGYPNGVDALTRQPLVINLDTTSNGVGNKARLDWLRKQFEKINLQLVVRSTDYNRFQDKLRKGDTQVFYFGWNADYPDSENFFFLLHGAQAKASNGGENAANYSNPEFDELFEQMKNMDNSPQRLALIDRMQTVLRRDSPWLWGYHPKRYVLRHGWLGNIKPNVMANNKLKYWNVDATQRGRLRRVWNQPSFWPLWLGAFLMLVLIAWVWKMLRKREEAVSTTGR